MHEIEHLAEGTERTPEEIAATMRENGTYSLLEEEISRQKALDFLVEHAVAVPMPEEETEETETEETEAGEPESGEARVEAAVEAGTSEGAGTAERVRTAERDEREENE
jgi:trigger factor